MAGLVITLTVVLPLLALWAAYITTALAAETDTRDQTPGRLVWVALHRCRIEDLPVVVLP